MSAWKLAGKKGGMVADNTLLVTVRERAIAFNANFIRHVKATSLSRVTFFIEDKDKQVGIKFSDDTADSYALTSDGGSSGHRSDGRSAQCESVINEQPWLLAAAKSINSRYTPTWDSVNSQWVISIAPSFDKKAANPRKVPSGIKGIYRYSFEEETVYIGRGDIKNRLASPERKDWDIDLIEYSVIEGQEDQEYWESYWLKKYDDEFGVLPKYNRIRGKRTSS